MQPLSNLGGNYLNRKARNLLAENSIELKDQTEDNPQVKNDFCKPN